MFVWTGRPVIQEFAQMIYVLRLLRIGYGFFQGEDPQGDALDGDIWGQTAPSKAGIRAPHTRAPDGMILVNLASPLPPGMAPA